MSIEELQEKRLSICKKCPLYKSALFGPICDSHKWLNIETGESSFLPKNDPKWIRGCNCKLDIKALNPESFCVAGKW